MKPWTKDSFVIGCLLVIFILVLTKLEKCDRIKNYKNITKSDTTIVYTSDTIWSIDTIFVYNQTPTLTDSIYIYEPDSVLCNYIREYQDTIDDTNITIYTTDLVKGKLLESGLSYKLKVPIKILDSVKITINNTIEPKIQLYTGLTLSKNIIAPMIGIQKNSLSLQGGYNILEKQPVIFIGYKFYSK